MTIKVINLNKLLKLLILPDNKLIGELRDDLRGERNKLLGKKSGGGHFQHPWWSAAKLHVIGAVELESQTEFLIDQGKQRRQRQRLYPLLTQGFLSWLKYLRRSTNQKIGWSDESVHNHFSLPGLDLTIKVDNILALRLGENSHKLVYPYFCENPILSERWARVGLWLMSQALPDYDRVDMEILDVLRGRSFGGSSCFLDGTEEAIFETRFLEVLRKWEELKPEYGL